MSSSIILNAAKNDLGSSKKRLIIALCICLLVFAANYKFLYNVTTGPFDAKTLNLNEPGIVEYVTSTGTFLNIGSQQKSLKVLGIKTAEGLDVGQYHLHPINGQMILVYTDNDFSGETVSGELKSIPSDLKSEIGDMGDAIYPYMIDAYVGYSISPNLFMLIALVAFPILLLLLVLQASKKGDPLKHPHIAKLKEFGDPVSLINEIDIEMVNSGVDEKIPLIHSSSKWLVIIGDNLNIFRQDSVVAYGVLGQKSGKHLILFVRGKIIDTTIYFPNEAADEACNKLKALLPEKFVLDAKAYQKQWDPKNPPLPNTTG